MLSQSDRVGGASIQESRCSLPASFVWEDVVCGDVRERRWIAWLRVCSADSVGVIITDIEGPTSVSESESSRVEGIVGPDMDGPDTGEGFLF